MFCVEGEFGELGWRRADRKRRSRPLPKKLPGFRHARQSLPEPIGN